MNNLIKLLFIKLGCRKPGNKMESDRIVNTGYNA